MSIFCIAVMTCTGSSRTGIQLLTERIFVIDGPSDSHEMDSNDHASGTSSKAAAQCQFRLASFTVDRSYATARRKTAEIAIFRFVVVWRDQICCVRRGSKFLPGR